MKASSLFFQVFLSVCLSSFGMVATCSAAPLPDGRAGDGVAGESVVVIPGPLRSFSRMAGISQKATTEEVMPLLAHNVFMLGYEGSKGRRTEFLVLLTRYVDQARELQALAGNEGKLKAANCDEAKNLLKILGYRARPDCGKQGSYLETADPQRAFLTIDSGFPLPELEVDLQTGKPFEYGFTETRLPALALEKEKKGKEARKDLLSELLDDPDMSRLYWALGRVDRETQSLLMRPAMVKRMEPVAAALDFYGSHISVKSGKVVVPGGAAAEAGWKDIVGASPQEPEEFIVRLLSKDNGWAAAYFDSLSQVNPVQQAHFTEPTRLKRFYEALKGKDATPAAVSGVFRRDPQLLLLLTQLTWDANGEPHVPGSLETWRKVIWFGVDGKISKEWNKRAKHFDNGQQVAEALFSLVRMQSEAGPVQAYLMACDLDSRRPPEHRLGPETVGLLAKSFVDFSGQYLVFSEFPELTDTSIAAFLRTARDLNNIPDSSVRGNAMGLFEANIGLWQILARQGQIPEGELNSSWQRIVKAFGKGTSVQAFDAGRNALKALLEASAGKPEVSQSEMINLLAGPPQMTTEGRQVHDALANRIRSIMEEQRLVSLDTLLTLGDGLHDPAKMKETSATLLPLAGELREFEMPQPIFRNSERDQWGQGIYNNQHTDAQMKTDLSKVIKTASTPQQLAEARGRLAPFLRDTLVGLNYAYYEPPASQMLHHNPLFVRSHDFSGATVMGLDKVWQAPQVFGAGAPAGGGAHLVGSLADLPYVLATIEQDFIAPENVQALIWREVAAGLLTNAIVPRWWGVTRNELHAVALHQEAGEELVAASAQNEELREKVMSILRARMAPRVAVRAEQALSNGRVTELISELTPADTFYLAAEYRRKFSGEMNGFGRAGHELDSLCKRDPQELSWEKLSRDFGVPHPVLTQSYARELVNQGPLPAYMGYSSRLLAESWDSNNLYWARLADEKGYSPEALNRLVPELTQRMVGKIFATDFEDWPALLRAERETGEEFRQGKIGTATASGTAARP